MTAARLGWIAARIWTVAWVGFALAIMLPSGHLEPVTLPSLGLASLPWVLVWVWNPGRLFHRP